MSDRNKSEPVSSTNGRLRIFLAAPSHAELSGLSLVLGGHLILGTDAAIPAGWFPFVVVSLLVVGSIVVLRIMALPFVLPSRQALILRWVQFVVIVGAIVLLYTTNLGLKTRVLMSENSLREYVEWLSNAQQMRTTRSRSCGLFTIAAAYMDKAVIKMEGSKVVWLQTVNGRRLWQPPYGLWAGVVYSEGREPPSTGESHYQHLFGPWWLWLEDI